MKIAFCKRFNCVLQKSALNCLNMKLGPTLRSFLLIASRRLHSGVPRPLSILFYGTDHFSLESLKVLFLNRLSGSPKTVDRLEVVSVRSQGVLHPVKQFAQENHILLYDWPHQPAYGEFDLGIVVSFGHLIPARVIEAFPLGMLNVHASLLPRLRGATPIIHAILNGDKETGVTLMQIAPHQFDVGKMLAQKSYAMPERITASELTNTLAKLGADLLIESLNNLDDLLKTSRVQDSSQATKAPKIRPEKARLLWSTQSCSDIDRLYRALNDTIKLQTSWHGETVRLTDMIDPGEMIEINVPSLLPKTKTNNAPGQIFYHKKRKLLCISCKDGWIAFCTVLVKGRPAMNARDFYNGFLTKVNREKWYFD